LDGFSKEKIPQADGPRVSAARAHADSDPERPAARKRFVRQKNTPWWVFFVGISLEVIKT